MIPIEESGCLDIVTGTVTGYNHEGMGVLRQERQVVFVPGALSGEEVSVRLDSRKKGGAMWGELIDIRKPSPYRRVPPCPNYSRCGGCQLQHASYGHQLQVKQEILARALAPLRKQGIPIQTLIMPVIPAPAPTGYRNKGVFAVSRAAGAADAAPAGGAVAIGFYGRKSREVAGHGCPTLFSARVNALLDDLALWLGRYGAVQTPSHIMIRESGADGKVILVLIGEKEPPWLPAFLDAFMPRPGGKSPDSLPRRGGQLAGAGWLASADKEGAIAGQKPLTLRGSLDIAEHYRRDPPIRFTISPESFFQVNSAQGERLCAEAEKACGLTGEEILWDMYCGAGTIGLYLASRAKAVLGMDAGASAIRDAWANARGNAAATAPPLHGRVCFLAGAAEDLAPSLLGCPALLPGMLKGQESLYTAPSGRVYPPHKALVRLLSEKAPDAVILDPPSKGAKPAVLQAIRAAAPRRVVYVSCDPATLSRDLQILAGGALYALEKVQPVDMFPQTAHVEAVASLRRCGS